MTRRPPFSTAVIGFGKIGAEYADDPAMARHYPFATHAQVLAAHSAFEWVAVVDPRRAAQARAQQRWGVARAYSSVARLAKAGGCDIAVLATPPEARLAAIAELRGLRAVIVEKPLGSSYAEAQAFVKACKQRGIRVQVNYWRRADATFQALAKGLLVKLIGAPQAVFGLYGNGLRNNGSHMIDFARMLFGEVEAASVLDRKSRAYATAFADDCHLSFQLRFSSGLQALFQPLDFGSYRENSLDIWGLHGRLQIVQEGLRLLVHRRGVNRAMQGEYEVASDSHEPLESSVGHAMYRMYDNLAEALSEGAPLCSSAESALITERLVQQLVRGSRARSARR